MTFLKLGQLGRGGTQPAGEGTFVYRKGNENHELGYGLFMDNIFKNKILSEQYYP
jgi:hypothetical protein